MPVQETNMGTIEIRKDSKQRDGDNANVMEIVRIKGKARGELDSYGKRIQLLVKDDTRRVETIGEWRYPWEVYEVLALALFGQRSGIIAYNETGAWKRRKKLLLPVRRGISENLQQKAYIGYSMLTRRY
ncbi:hypothetical protein GHT06_022598 [Daphnia sinensis]|uniref:Uncharacterized protein n=1 Tax=Daphnia sinensis TaxID=1820382 RepID=A0AAD5PNT1_9CRUS|nr:hypothetical protein GHT06_022598 [Daphnia sinensis]